MGSGTGASWLQTCSSFYRGRNGRRPWHLHTIPLSPNSYAVKCRLNKSGGGGMSESDCSYSVSKLEKCSIHLRFAVVGHKVKWNKIKSLITLNYTFHTSPSIHSPIHPSIHSSIHSPIHPSTTACTPLCTIASQDVLSVSWQRTPHSRVHPPIPLTPPFLFNHKSWLNSLLWRHSPIPVKTGEADSPKKKKKKK